MRIIIAGAGRVGRRVAAELDQTHEIILIDNDADRVDGLGYELDVLPLLGDCSDPETLEEAGISDTDLLVACTDDDEINLLTCETAKVFSEVTTVARVKSLKYVETWDRGQNVFGVDFMVGTNLLTVATAVGGTGLASARSLEVFAGGTVQLAEFDVDSASSIAGQTVSQLDRFQALTFTTVVRDEETVIPKGSTRVEAGDRLVVVGTPEAVHDFGAEFSHKKSPTEHVLIVGGSDIGHHIAELLEKRGLRPHLLEADRNRARELSERLSNTTVRNKSPTDRYFLNLEKTDKI